MFQCTCTVPSFPNQTKIGVPRSGFHVAVPKPMAAETAQPGSITMEKVPAAKTLHPHEAGKKAMEKLPEGEGFVELVGGTSTVGMVGRTGQKKSGLRSGAEGSGARSSGCPKIRMNGQLWTQLAALAVMIGPGRTHRERSGQVTGQGKNSLQDMGRLPGGGGLCCSRRHKRLAWCQLPDGTGTASGCAVPFKV